MKAKKKPANNRHIGELVSFHVPAETKKRLREYAKRNGRSVAGQLRVTVENMLNGDSDGK